MARMSKLSRTRIASEGLQVGTTIQCSQAGNHHAVFLILGKIGVEHIADELPAHCGLLADRFHVVGWAKVTKHDLYGV